MANELYETYEIIEDLCNIKLGVGDKFILNKIIQDSKKKNIDFLVDGAQHIIRDFSLFFPDSEDFNSVLRRIENSERNACNQWTEYQKNENAC